MKPLLSICIPTFSRAHLLEICLNSLLPQIERHSSQVECVICDNASTDNTRDILSQHEPRSFIRVFHNDKNIGVIGNITNIVSAHAEGDYIWLIGDDDMVTSGAVDRIIEVLQSPHVPDLVALNVGFISEAHRPNADEVFNGFAAAPKSLLRQETESGVFLFEDLLTGPCADFTASYSVLLKRDLWLKHFPQAYLGEPFISVRTTYPHAAIIAAEMPGKPAVYIAEPSVVVFERPTEHFSWARYHAINTLVHATQLLNVYEEHGVSRRRLRPYFIHQVTQQGNALGDLLWNRDTAGGMWDGLRYLWLTKRHPWPLFKACCNAMTHDAAPKWCAVPFQTARTVIKKLRLTTGR